VSRFGVQVEKTTSFRGSAQPFSNTYYYEAAVTNAPANSPTVIGYANDLLDDVVSWERGIHGTNVTFVMARCWSQIGPKEQNEMIVQRSLSGAGTGAAPSTAADKERAFLIRFRAGNDSRGRPVYLRKWLHLDIGVIASEGITNTQLVQTAQLTAGQRAQLVTWGDQIKQVTPGAGPPANLVSKNGRPIDGATIAHPYYEHHQLGDAWRGT
jgi:hypothetical protein